MDEWIADGQEGECPPEPAVPAVEWRPGEPLVCGVCRMSTRSALLEVDVLASELAREVDGHRPPVKWSRVSGSRPKPAVSPVAELLDDLVGDLLKVEDGHRRAVRWPARVSLGRGADVRSRSVAYLVDHLDGVLAREELVGLVDVALTWLRRLSEEPGWSPARCRCGERVLNWDAQVGFFVCSACGRHVSQVEERGLVADEAG
ncbi:hypothetical protein [Streptosporangium canum]|uniref:hypothetical protein n=1 Tax=Streptosporangium canum TaxID=324952 RepID=UPI00379DB62E